MIKVTVSKKEPAKIEVFGVSGESCTSITEGIEKALGGEILEENKKPEYYEVNSLDNYEEELNEQCL